MAEIVLDNPQAIAAVGECEPAGMAEHVWMDVTEIGALPGGRDDVVHRLPGQRLFPLRDKQPGQRIIPLREPPADRAQFVTGDRLFDAEPVFEAGDPEARLCQINVFPAHRNGFGHPQPVAEHHQDQKMVPDAVPSLFRGGEELLDLRQTEVIAAPLVFIRRPAVHTFYISPFGHCSTAPLKPQP